MSELQVGQVVRGRAIGPDAAGHHFLEEGPGYWLVAERVDRWQGRDYHLALVHLSDGTQGNKLLLTPEDVIVVPHQAMPWERMLDALVPNLIFEVTRRVEYVVQQ